MTTEEAIKGLKLLSNTIEELEIDQIISINYDYGEMSCHVMTLKLIGDDGIWAERYDSYNYPWEKSFYHNNIRFFSLYTEKEYLKEKSNVLS